MATPNTLFAVLGVTNIADVEQKLLDLHPWVSLKIGEGQWFLLAPAATTTKEVSDKLGFTAGEPALNGIVLRVENYFGRSFLTTWDWITTKQGVELGTQAV